MTLNLIQCLRVICGCRAVQTNSAERHHWHCCTCSYCHYNYNQLRLADDKTRNPGILGGIYSRFYVIATSSCTSWVGVCCRLLNLSMDNSTVLGFSDTSGDYKGLVSNYRTPYTQETLPRLSRTMIRVVIAYLGLQ